MGHFGSMTPKNQLIFWSHTPYSIKKLEKFYINSPDAELPSQSTQAIPFPNP